MKRLLRMLNYLMIAMTAAIYFYSLLGGDFFLLPMNRVTPQWLDDVLSLVMLSSNFLLHFGIVCKAPLLKYGKHAILATILVAIATALTPSTSLIAVELALIPALVLIVSSPKEKRMKIIVRYGFMYIVMAVFQFATIEAKMHLPIFTSLFQGALFAKVVYQIDVSILLVALYFYSRGGGEWNALEHRLGKQDFGTMRSDREDHESVAKLEALPKNKRRKALALLVLIQLMQFLVIGLVGIIGNRGIETCVIALSFAAFGTIIKRRWHSDSVAACTMFSAILFFCVARILPSFRWSQFIPLISGGLLAYSLYLLDVHLVRYQEALEPPKKLFQCYTASPEEFEQRCIELGMDLLQRRFAIDALSCNRLKNPELVLRYGPTIDSIKQRKRRLKAQMEDTNKAP